MTQEFIDALKKNLKEHTGSRLMGWLFTFIIANYVFMNAEEAYKENEEVILQVKGKLDESDYCYISGFNNGLSRGKDIFGKDLEF